MEKKAFRHWKEEKIEMGRRAKRDTVNYTLRRGRKVVYKGITKNPKKRASDHKRSGKKFTSMTTSVKVSRKTAMKREKARLKSYKKSHRGRRPRYNKKS